MRRPELQPYEGDPEAYERETLARTKDVLGRFLEVAEREELREVRLEGSYPDTCMLVTIWDARSPRPHERQFRTRIWGPNFDTMNGVYEPPDRAAHDIARRATGG